jgi:hypothetical protein
MSVHDSRTEQITQITAVLELIRVSPPTPDVDPLGGNILGFLDYYTELHRLIWEWE